MSKIIGGDHNAVANNKNATTQTADVSQSSLKEPIEKSTAASPATIVSIGAANAAEPPVIYSFSRSTGVVTPPPTQAQQSLEFETRGTSGGIGKPPPTQTQQPLEFESQGTSGGIGKPPPSQ